MPDFAHHPNGEAVTTRLNRAALGWLLLRWLLRMLRRSLELRKPWLIKKWATVDRNTILARVFFSLGEFETAMARALRHLESRPDDFQIRFVALGCAVELGDFRSAEQHMRTLTEKGVPETYRRQLACFRYAIARAGTPVRTPSAISQLDGLYSELGCRSVRVGTIVGDKVFDALSAGRGRAAFQNAAPRPLTEGPLVSVVMTAFNVEDLVTTAVNSILNQSYRCLELIVVDDFSTDGTLEVLRCLAHDDRRMRVIAKTNNDGTYVSKNLGIKECRGEYVALQDSDDWSHPDRLGKCIALLEEQSEVVALTTEWMRMTNQGTLIIQSTTKCVYRACISLVFRRQEVLTRAGFFDSVRAEGDAEYIERLEAIFGAQRVLELPWPLAFGRFRSEAITTNSKLGLVRGRAKPARAAYRKAYKRWHTCIRDGADGYLPFPLLERPFAAPQAMLPDTRP